MHSVVGFVLWYFYRFDLIRVFCLLLWILSCTRMHSSIRSLLLIQIQAMGAAAQAQRPRPPSLQPPPLLEYHRASSWGGGHPELPQLASVTEKEKHFYSDWTSQPVSGKSSHPAEKVQGFYLILCLRFILNRTVSEFALFVPELTKINCNQACQHAKKLLTLELKSIKYVIHLGCPDLMWIKPP